MTDEATGLNAIEAELAGYPHYVATTQMCEAIFKVLPGMPQMPLYKTLEECAEAVQPHTLPEVLARARELGDDPGVGRALFAAKSIDTGDTGITVVTGVRSALSLFLGTKGPGAGAAQQQKTDAVLKALALAFIITRLIGREPGERVDVLKSIPAGQELLAYYAAVEIALPFTDDVASAGGTFIADLIEDRSKSIASKLLGVIGQEGLSDAQEALRHLTRTLDDLALFFQPHANHLAVSVKSILPAAFGSGDSLRDLVAAGADALPVYRYLVSRMALESRLALAKIDLMPDIPMEDLSEREVVPVAPPPPVPPELITPENPFAAPEPEEAVSAPSSQITTRSGARIPLPTEVLSPERRLNGVYMSQTSQGEQWFVFTAEGIFSSAPPPAQPADWSALRDAGHPVGTYSREGSAVTVQWPDQDPASFEVVPETYAVVVDGVRCVRCDYALAGSFLSGTYAQRDGESSLILGADGTSSRGNYVLDVAAITWNGEQTESLFSTLEPTAASPQTLYLGGVAWDLIS